MLSTSDSETGVDNRDSDYGDEEEDEDDDDDDDEENEDVDDVDSNWPFRHSKKDWVLVYTNYILSKRK